MAEATAAGVGVLRAVAVLAFLAYLYIMGNDGTDRD